MRFFPWLRRPSPVAPGTPPISAPLPADQAPPRPTSLAPPLPDAVPAPEATEARATDLRGLLATALGLAPDDPRLAETIAQRAQARDISDDPAQADPLQPTLQEWLDQPTYREERRYLERHLELLDETILAFFARRVAALEAERTGLLDELRRQRIQVEEEKGGEQAQATLTTLREQLQELQGTIDFGRTIRDLLRYAIDHDGTPAAVRAAYVNAYGGLVLDLPDWLMDAERQDGALAQRGRPEQVAAARAALWRAALARAQQEQLALEIQAELANRFANRLSEDPRIDRAAALETRIAAYTAVLSAYRQDRYPYAWAGTQNNLGNAFSERIRGERADNLEQAIACYQAALLEYTRDAAPLEHRQTLLNAADVHARRQEWHALHAAYAEAFHTEQQLLALASGPHDRDAIIRDGREAGTRDGFALARLGRREDALVAVERARARALAAARALDGADPRRITDPRRRERYLAAVAQLREAQAALHQPRPAGLADAEWRTIELERSATARTAQEAFEASIAAIHAARDPADFFQDDVEIATLARAARRGGEAHALAYLLATPWGELALIARPDQPPLAVDLPRLTSQVVDDLIQRQLDDGSGRVIDGFAHAQEGNGLGLILRDWPGKTFADRSAALHAACIATAQASALDDAAQEMLGSVDVLVAALEPLDHLTAEALALLNGTLRHAFLSRALHRCLPLLGELALRPLALALHDAGVASVILIPCGALAAFPLLCAPLEDDPDPAHWRTFADALPASLAPSARTLLRGDRTQTRRAGVATLGDPDTTLPWGEAEAHTVAKLARQAGLAGEARVQTLATLAWLLEILRRAQVVDASCHGKADGREFLRSRIFVQDGALTLGEALAGQVTDLHGLRLLILSACETAILDLRGARDEVRSLLVGFLQAGAEAVMGAWWAVDDKATYLLIVRFAEIWLPHMATLAPAVALAQAWLRSRTNADLHAWADAFNHPTADERRAAGSAHPDANPQAAEAAQDTASTLQGAIKRTRGGREPRMDLDDALATLRQSTRRQPQAHPFADPVFWAGFQLTGW